MDFTGRGIWRTVRKLHKSGAKAYTRAKAMKMESGFFFFFFFKSGAIREQNLKNYRYFSLCLLIVNPEHSKGRCSVNTYWKGGWTERQGPSVYKRS